ncbi:hypothetical protein B0H63DRAFT_519022 [Podospora didyma]|uniref:Uncharacterized protein n=1 Tax=Podospora didyma TaxID=330526 RepID=A0AAE0NY74_9PEZI|nr:hypothetical protein B0H63DRAFT_519022 [Podospora didyma]
MSRSSRGSDEKHEKLAMGHCGSDCGDSKHSDSQSGDPSRGAKSSPPVDRRDKNPSERVLYLSGSRARVSIGPVPPQQNPLIPFNGVVTREDNDIGKAIVCHGFCLLLCTFAAINAAAGVLSLVLGHRRVLHRLTCGILGKPDCRGYLVTWLLYVGLQLGGNAGVALLMKSAPGYFSSFSIVELMIFLTARPRFGWLFMAFAHDQVTLLQEEDGEKKGSSSWMSSAIASSFGEVAIQLVSLYVMGSVAAFAAPRGYYKVSTAE